MVAFSMPPWTKVKVAKKLALPADLAENTKLTKHNCALCGANAF